jgi:hypothetical protein
MLEERISAEEKLAFSVPKFCAIHGICFGTYWNLKKRGEQPREMLVGRRVLISVEAAKEWRKEREAATYQPKTRRERCSPTSCR